MCSSSLCSWLGAAPSRLPHPPHPHRNPAQPLQGAEHVWMSPGCAADLHWQMFSYGSTSAARSFLRITAERTCSCRTSQKMTTMMMTSDDFLHLGQWSVCPNWVRKSGSSICCWVDFLLRDAIMLLINVSILGGRGRQPSGSRRGDPVDIHVNVSTPKSTKHYHAGLRLNWIIKIIPVFLILSVPPGCGTPCWHPLVCPN